jgi:hypothetical protein
LLQKSSGILEIVEQVVRVATNLSRTSVVADRMVVKRSALEAYKKTGK